MNIDIAKEMIVEYCENIYALAITYLHNNNNLELSTLIKELTMLEDNIRSCKDMDVLHTYRVLLNQLVNKIEGIINE